MCRIKNNLTKRLISQSSHSLYIARELVLWEEEKDFFLSLFFYVKRKDDNNLCISSVISSCPHSVRRRRSSLLSLSFVERVEDLVLVRDGGRIASLTAQAAAAAAHHPRQKAANRLSEDVLYCTVLGKWLLCHCHCCCTSRQNQMNDATSASRGSADY